MKKLFVLCALSFIANCMEQQTPKQKPPTLQGKKRTAPQTLSPIKKRFRLETTNQQAPSNLYPESKPQTFQDLKYINTKLKRILKIISAPKKLCPVCNETKGHCLSKHTEFLRKNFR